MIYCDHCEEAITPASDGCVDAVTVETAHASDLDHLRLVEVGAEKFELRITGVIEKGRDDSYDRHYHEPCFAFIVARELVTVWPDIVDPLLEEMNAERSSEQS